MQQKIKNAIIIITIVSFCFESYSLTKQATEKELTNYQLRLVKLESKWENTALPRFREYSMKAEYYLEIDVKKCLFYRQKLFEQLKLIAKYEKTLADGWKKIISLLLSRVPAEEKSSALPKKFFHFFLAQRTDQKFPFIVQTLKYELKKNIPQ